jgi:Ca2+-binding EF-hand superfamily protein
MKKMVPISALAALLLAGGAAYAQSAQPRATPAAAPHRHATNAQTRATVEARATKMFARFDSNHDGFITKAEIDALHAQRAQKAEQRAQRFDPSKIFDRLDLNHDGRITVAEAQAERSQRLQAKGGEHAPAHGGGFTGLFARADSNKDGAVTRAEFETMGEQLRTRMQHASMARRGGSRLFETADSNKDGRISQAELQQSALANFDRMDLNHDGTITPEERQQARQQTKAQRHAR